ncbi:MAG TPA: NAD(P)/FAD-dependent oxidoreductase [Candidatus Avacidaminococcus intestinavium]|uniref:NAD(P)/FAD-dependent oxidoreductase n=1 Tax=Candidatus Avacidaminococcus intestinavium TaxID=2840684 RepID=A0A9D1SM32_9FIRM|nr:NAD(P)/FAD-dependent oxidoreductase [Candidatus Avacidaminococcus intestinavium]
MDIYDVAIIGGGPAGLSAAVTCGVRNKKMILFDSGGFSAKLKKAQSVKNYLGFPEISGTELMNQFLEHAREYQPTIITEKVVFAATAKQGFDLGTANTFYKAKTVILATGGMTATLLPGEKELLGRGVSYCATCDGHFFKGKIVAVILDGLENPSDLEFLSEICARVLVFSKKELQTSFVASNVEFKIENIKKIVGSLKVEGIEGAQDRYPVDGVFIFRESDPVDALFAGIELQGKSVAVQADLATNIPGVFAAGDCTGYPWQISRATGEGLVAALSAVKYLAEQKTSKE